MALAKAQVVAFVYSAACVIAVVVVTDDDAAVVVLDRPVEAASVADVIAVDDGTEAAVAVDVDDAVVTVVASSYCYWSSFAVD